MRKRKETPTSRKLTSEMRAKAIEMGATGAPARIVALALGYTTREFNQWMDVGKQEDEDEEREGGVPANLADERYEAILMYRALKQVWAKFAVDAFAVVSKKIKKGSLEAAIWWINKSIDEYKPGVETNAAPAAQVLIMAPDNGRVRK